MAHSRAHIAPRAADGASVALMTRKREATLGAVPPPITIRRLRPGDDAVLTYLATHNADFGSIDERGPLEPLGQAETMAFLADDRTATLVAFSGEEPVGFCYVNEMYRRHSALRHLCIYELAVSDRFRGQGIGNALIEAVADHALAQGITRGFVVASASDAAAAELYGSSGGVSTGNEVIFAFDWDA